MSNLPQKIQDRIKTAVKRFQPILQSAKARDINESDTVLIIIDMLENIFGYDKFMEITSEHAIRGTRCDLAVKLDGNLKFLIEVKAIGIDLKEIHVKQAVDYAANQGMEWVVLTNGINWRLYKVTFGKPIENEIIVEFSFLDLVVKSKADMDKLALIAKESWKKSELEQYYSFKKVLNRFTIGALLTSDACLKLLRKELKGLSSDIKISEVDIKTILLHEVIKRDVLEGEKAILAQKQVNKSEKKKLQKSVKADSTTHLLKVIES